MTASVLVIGGGISGLAAAHSLLQADPDLAVRVVEADARLGGTLGTDVTAGFVFERGANGFQDSVPDTLQLAREVGLGERLLASSPSARRRYVYHRGRLVPVGPRTLFFSSLLPLSGRLRLLSEPFRGRRPGDVEEESVAAFGRRRLGASVTRTLLDPVVTGVFAGDVERTSVDAAFPRLVELESRHGSLFRGFLKSRRRTPRRLWSFPGGLQELVDALDARLGEERVRLGAAATALSAVGEGGWRVAFGDGREETAQAVVVALPAPRAAGLFSASNPELARALEAMPYAPVAVVCLGYAEADVAHDLDGFGFLVPRAERMRSLGAIWVSSLFPPHAPQGHVNLRVLLGGAHDPEGVGRSAEDLVDTVSAEIGPVLGLRGAPRASRVYRYMVGIPQYNLGHARRLRRIADQLEDLPGVFLTGNAYRGVGLNDCVREGRQVAADVTRFLRREGVS